MLPILAIPRDLFNQNPIFPASLKIPWETSTQAEENLLLYPHEARNFLQNIETLSELYHWNNIDHLPQIIASIKLSTIASPNFREISEILAVFRLITIQKLLPVHVQVCRILKWTMQNLSRHGMLTNAKVHSVIKENGDFETIILADPPDRGPYFFTKLLSKKIRKYLRSRHRRKKLDCPEITVHERNEENEEMAFIEMEIGKSRIIIRDLSSQCYRRDFNPLKPFNVQDESSSFRSKLLTDQLFFIMAMFPQDEKDFPQDICPFLVRYFLRTTHTRTLLNFENLPILQRIQEEHLLLNEFLRFFRNLENLFKALYEAQTSLRGFGDYDCIRKGHDGKYSINEYSDYADTCKKLVDTLRSQVVPEDLGEEESATDYGFFLEEALH